MICQLTIRNFAIIDDLTIDFSTGFTVFTGETGAGKSIIIDALSLLLGERASSSMIRHGTAKAIVEGVFEPKTYFDLLHEYVQPGERLIVTKEIDNQGRSTSRINGRIVNLSTIRQIMAKIIDIHNQNENQYLLDSSSHLSLLDNFSLMTQKEVYHQYQNTYQLYRQLLVKKEALLDQKYDREKFELLNHQKSEIEAINLQEDEIENLEIERTRILQHEKIAEKIRLITDYFEDERGISSALYSVKRVFESLGDDPLFTDISHKVSDYYFELDALYDDFKQRIKSINYDPSRVEEIQSRIFEINKIKRKYGQSYTAIQESYQSICQDIDNLNHLEQEKAHIDSEISRYYQELLQLGQKLHGIRLENAPILEQQIKQQLADLHLEKARFSIQFFPQPPSSNGIFAAEFYISLNVGSPVRPLVKVISGGEMSRLMLGLKVIFNTIYGISATIFDEIDAGVSGKIASAVGKKMQALSEDMQVICITHLPQVAALADLHYYVDKKVKMDATATEVTKLDQKQRIVVLAQMLSSEQSPSNAAIQNAKELISKKK